MIIIIKLIKTNENFPVFDELKKGDVVRVKSVLDTDDYNVVVTNGMKKMTGTGIVVRIIDKNKIFGKQENGHLGCWWGRDHLDVL